METLLPAELATGMQLLPACFSIYHSHNLQLILRSSVYAYFHIRDGLLDGVRGAYLPLTGEAWVAFQSNWDNDLLFGMRISSGFNSRKQQPGGDCASQSNIEFPETAVYPIDMERIWVPSPGDWRCVRWETRVRSFKGAVTWTGEALSGTRNLGAPRAVAGCVCPLRPAVAGASSCCACPVFPAFRRGRSDGRGDRAILRHPPLSTTAGAGTRHAPQRKRERCGELSRC